MEKDTKASSLCPAIKNLKKEEGQEQEQIAAHKQSNLSVEKIAQKLKMEIFQNQETLHNHKLQIRKLELVIKMLPAIDI